MEQKTANKNLYEKLDNLLLEDIAITKEREANTFDRLTDNKKVKIVIFGAGKLGLRTFEGLKKIDIEIVCFSDNNKVLWNTSIEGLIVLSPNEAVIKYPDAVFILTIYSAHIGHPLRVIQKQLSLLGSVKLISFIYLFWKYHEIFLPYWRCDLPHKTIEQFELVSAAFSIWSDDLSRKEYFAQIYWRLTGDDKYFTKPVSEEQYFPKDIFELNTDEVFVDIGAFDGDTLKVFINESHEKFKHYYGYEPDQFGFDKLKDYVSEIPNDLKDKMTFKPIGIGSYNKKIKIETPGVYFKVLYPEETNLYLSNTKSVDRDVDSMSLDSIDFKNNPTYLKMDVEGFEPEVIFGAKNIIKENKPILAISIYHKFDHIWRLPLAINALTDGYTFFLRPHFHAGWELVFYAVPKHRVKIKVK